MSIHPWRWDRCRDATLSGGGALPKTIDTTATIAPKPATFDLLAPGEGGPDAPITDEDGFAATSAGSHPFQLTSSLGFPTDEPEPNLFLVGAGHLRDIFVDFPRGLVVNPTATTALCTEAELATITSPGCPATSAVGLITVITNEVGLKAATSPLYNMVPPPGPAALGFNALGVGVFPHVIAEIRTDSDFGASGGTRDPRPRP